ncbi:hypothetical protein QYM36_016942 [Artemia franciscana]|uniref:Uncharacterized protein n=1 Tax=Artemia franciscana TaxID=6661 RepID=A0AA88KSH3_ARTSF|nr:hypothetical protein QYM36_016942 [Artemia franciscana]
MPAEMPADMVGFVGEDPAYGRDSSFETGQIRSNSFRKPDDLRYYLEALSNYYAVQGRPRFGKRSGMASRLILPKFKTLQKTRDKQYSI